MQQRVRSEQPFNRFVLASLLIHALLFILFPSWLQEMLGGVSAQRGGVVEVVAVSPLPAQRASAPPAAQQTRPPTEARPQPQAPPDAQPSPVVQSPPERAPAPVEVPQPQRAPESVRPEPVTAPVEAPRPSEPVPQPQPDAPPQRVTPERAAPQTARPQPVEPAPAPVERESVVPTPTPEPQPVVREVLASPSSPAEVAVSPSPPAREAPRPAPAVETSAPSAPETRRPTPQPTASSTEPAPTVSSTPRVVPQPAPAPAPLPVERGEPTVSMAGRASEVPLGPARSAASPGPVVEPAPNAAPSGNLEGGTGADAQGNDEQSIPPPRGSDMVSFGGQLIYPKTAQDRGFTGQVVVAVTVQGSAGRARDVRLVESSGYEALDQAALLFVTHRAQFQPASSDYTAYVEIVFRRVGRDDQPSDYQVEIRVRDQLDLHP